MESFNRGFHILCDKCTKDIAVDLSCTDESVFHSIIDMVARIKIHCQSCNHHTENSALTVSGDIALNPTITQIQLESYKILMSEMTDSGFDAKLEWGHAENLKSLLANLGLSNGELDNRLANPNLATPSKGILWIELSNTACRQISDALKEKGIR